MVIVYRRHPLTLQINQSQNGYMTLGMKYSTPALEEERCVTTREGLPNCFLQAASSSLYGKQFSSVRLTCCWIISTLF